jgi:manganese/zinc/iron transport system permease protein
MAALLLESFVIRDEMEIVSIIIVLFGAFLSCLAGMYIMEILKNRFRVSSDASLCFVLAAFFGIGITIVSLTQGSYPVLYKQMQSYLFGQAATMTDVHLYIYSALSLIVLIILLLFFRPIHLVLFDPQFAESIGVNCKRINLIILNLLVLSVVIGIRSVGVVLMSAMLIFPTVSARAWTNRFLPLLFIAGLFGLVSGYCGVFLSHEMSLFFAEGNWTISFPTGPMIVMIAAIIFLFSQLFSPKSGLTVRAIRRLSFLLRCEQENLLKNMWKLCSENQSSQITYQSISKLWHKNKIFLRIVLKLLQNKGWLRQTGRALYELTPSGMLWGRKIIRLHRLWEVYLVECCGMAKERVHPSAEEMEHIITPEIEIELVKLLRDPEKDPHARPIPLSDEKTLLAERRPVS